MLLIYIIKLSEDHHAVQTPLLTSTIRLLVLKFLFKKIVPKLNKGKKQHILDIAITFSACCCHYGTLRASVDQTESMVTAVCYHPNLFRVKERGRSRCWNAEMTVTIQVIHATASVSKPQYHTSTPHCSVAAV